MSSKIHVLSHPIINERLSKLRQSGTSSKEFREVWTFSRYLDLIIDFFGKDIHNISLLLGFEASRDLQEETFVGVRSLIVTSYSQCY